MGASGAGIGSAAAGSAIGSTSVGEAFSISVDASCAGSSGSMGSGWTGSGSMGSATVSGSDRETSPGYFRLEEKMSGLLERRSGVTWTMSSFAASSFDASSLEPSPAEPAGSGSEPVFLPRLARFLLLMEPTA